MRASVAISSTFHKKNSSSRGVVQQQAVLLLSHCLQLLLALMLLMLLPQVDMSDVLRLKHARHNAQPTARQQLQQQQDSPVSTAAGGLGSAGGPGCSDAPQVLRRVCPAFKGWRQHQRPGSCAAIGVEMLGRKVRAGFDTSASSCVAGTAGGKMVVAATSACWHQI
jgi:hypothetical protein